MRVIGVLFVLVLGLGCKTGSDESFCAAQKSAYVNRCTEGCLKQQGSSSNARSACEQQCLQTLPYDPQYAARCVRPGASASAAASAAPPR